MGLERRSALYRVRVMHSRLSPRRHAFSYGLFMFALDLDELDTLDQLPWPASWLFGRNRFALYSFQDRDHFDFTGRSPKACILEYLGENGIALAGGRILLVTHLRTLGYIFNPVSFYYCLDREGQARAVVAEVGNTFGEMKLFLIPDAEKTAQGAVRFRRRVPKFYYVSPFVPLDAEFDFQLPLPAERMDIQIDDYEAGEKVLITKLRGERRSWSNQNLLALTLRYPMVTLGVITLIHWNALRLYLKKVKYYGKAEQPGLQREIRRGGHLK